MPGYRVVAVLVCAALAMNAARSEGAEIRARITDQHGKPIADAVVVAVVVGQPEKAPMKRTSEAIFQVDKEFVPVVSVIRIGTAISFPNNDTVRHHVYSFSPAKKFELPLYQGMPAEPVVFDKPGVIVLGCNIHEWMVAYIYVSESPYFAKTGSDGKATIADLPRRNYVLRAWHPQLDGSVEQTRKTIDMSNLGRIEATWALKLRPDVRSQQSARSRSSYSY
ncbi:MAG TPA: methylamine utilization protein [Casimicrobiaceae bacterium]|nr:methylamine utilization protein [Casimicrobiaceae bacterium]